MSFRLFSHRLIKHGRYLLHNFYGNKQIHTNILEHGRNRNLIRNNNFNAETKVGCIHEYFYYLKPIKTIYYFDKCLFLTMTHGINCKQSAVKLAFSCFLFFHFMSLPGIGWLWLNFAHNHFIQCCDFFQDGVFNVAKPALRATGLFRFGQHARRLFVDNILNRVTPIYSADLRNEAKRKWVSIRMFVRDTAIVAYYLCLHSHFRFLYGDSTSFFALIGISLASGTGILTKDDELEGVCWEIRVSFQNCWTAVRHIN